jgi:predicted MFS family arabinose efflux permease
MVRNHGETLSGDRLTFSDVLKVREFRILWIADAQSLAGDQLARVALSVLVFERTASSVLTALTYALTFLPALFGGALLTGLADRLPRRQLMVWCDLIRAAAVGFMAIPGLPLTVICALLVVAVLVGTPFGAAESALIPVILEGDSYVVGYALRSMTAQLSQLAGFAGGGIVIAAVGPRGGLAINAATFALSAMLIAIGLRRRPAAHSSSDGPSLKGYLASIASGARLIFSDKKLRILIGLGWLSGFLVVPEGVAAPFASQLGGGARATGFLMASMPAGTALGTFLYMKFVSAPQRPRTIGLLAVLAPLALVPCLFGGSLATSLMLWFASGFFGAYLVQVYAEFARAVPDERRGQAIGIAGSGSLVAQGVGVLLGGGIAGSWSPAVAVGLAGVFGALLALLLAIAWSTEAAYKGSHSPDQVVSAEGGGTS